MLGVELNKIRELLNIVEFLLLDLVKVMHALKLFNFIFEHSRDGDTPRRIPRKYKYKYKNTMRKTSLIYDYGMIK